MSSGTDEITREQQYVTSIYERLDALREETAARLKGVLRQSGGTHQHRLERDADAVTTVQRLAQLDSVENGLCFGRLDRADGDRLYVGRIGIRSDDEEYEPLLVDWRAPAARPFYVATAAAPDGVRRRRHIRTRRRTVVGLDDDVLDGQVLEPGDGSENGALVGEGALLAALNRGRTGHMRDVVETIQAEQDRAIRAPFAGVQVVQGGPGTGKTAVALHRAAYLLYTHRRQLERRGVLIVGPNTAFLRYISQVLPALGESSAVLATLGQLYPGVVADGVESTTAAEIKGRTMMADVVAAAVADRQHVPDEPVEIVVDGDRYLLSPATVADARERARRAHPQHNHARQTFVDTVLDALARQVVDRLNEDPFGDLTRDLDASIAEELGVDPEELGDQDFLDEESVTLAVRDLTADPAVRSVLDWLWPELTPQRLLTDLFASPDRLASAAPQLTADEREVLLRLPAADPFSAAARPGEVWTPADVPLLDEAAELLGVVDTAAEAAAARRRQQAVEYAQGVLEVISGSAALESEDVYERENFLLATDLVDAEMLADRAEDVDLRTVAERAVGDRTWAYGHVVVDEAQELSAMAWRLLMRRCPTKSMTVVGDVAQTGDPAGTLSWGRVLAPYVEDRWRLAELTVNYRTPAEVMAVAAKTLARIDPGLVPPRSVRESGVAPWEEWVTPAGLELLLPELVEGEAESVVGGFGEVGDSGSLEGRVAVIAPAGRVTAVGEMLAGAMGGAGGSGAGEGGALEGGVSFGAELDLECRTVVLTARQAKGLEFDAVVVVDPAGIVAEGPRGENDLYVALTRATQRLGVLNVTG